MRFPTRSLPVFLGFFAGFAPVFHALGLEETAFLKFTYKSDQAQISLLHDLKGNAYLPLLEAAQFYGIQVQFDSQTRRIFLTKGKNKVKLVLSQPLFMATDPEMSVPIEPAEMLSGQLAIPPQSAEEVFATLLDIQMNYIPEQKTLLAGGVKEETSTLTMAAPTPLNNSSAVPANNAAVEVAQATPTAAPSGDSKPVEKEEGVEKEAAGPLEEEAPAGKTIRVRRIIIDAGHGGPDAGAPAHDRRYMEKQATLDIAKKVAERLREEPGLEVLLTRNDDYFITLKYRTDFANSHKGDLFVSIHCNSNPRERANGTEIYYYGAKASNKWAALAAERENRGELDTNDPFMTQLKTDGYKRFSDDLAKRVEKQVEERLGQHFRNIQRAPFYVLAHSDMPSILVETAFISNPREELKLMDPYWRDNMAKAIVAGILDYKDDVDQHGENQEARR